MAQEALLRLHERRRDVENPDGVPHHRHDAARDRRAALRARAARGLRRLVAAGAAGRGRRRARVEDEETVSLAFLVAARAPQPGRARGARAARVVRLRRSPTIAEILDMQRGQLPPDPQPRAPPRRRRARRASTPTRASAAALAARFLDAAREGDMDGLVALLAPDAVLVGDGGGKARALAGARCTAPPTSPARCVAFGRPRRASGASRFEPALVNGQPGFRTVAPDGRLVNVVGDRDRGRRRPPPLLDAQPRQARPPRPAVGPRPAAVGAANPTAMTPATPSAARLRNRDIAPMLNTPYTNSRRVMDHSNRVAVVREAPRPAANLAW